MTETEIPDRDPVAPCPCGAGPAYQQCCGPLHAGADAPTAEALMRSRYAAFVFGDGAYLWRTWHSQTRPATVEIDPGLQWTGLEVLRTVRGTSSDRMGTVKFRASYRRGGIDREQGEVSSFVREDGRWVYRDALP